MKTNQRFFGHDFGVREKNRSAASGWPVRFEEWLADLGLLKRP